MKKYRFTLTVILCLLEIAFVSAAYATESNNKRAEAYNYQGISYFQNGDNALALKAFNAAILLYPDYPISYANRGRIYESKKQYDLAIKDYSIAIELAPTIAKTFYNRGNAYRKLGKSELALKDYSTAIRLNPNYTKAFENRGILYWLSSRDKTKACLDLKMACALDSCNAAYDMLNCQ